MTTINQIQQEILDAMATAAALPATAILTDNEKATLPNLTSTSRVSILRLFVFVVASVIWARQKRWEILQKDIDNRARQSRPFGKDDLIELALNYQHGDAIPLTGVYDNTGVSIRDIAQKRIIARAAVDSFIVNGFGSVNVKAAKLVNNELEKIPAEELAGFDAYMKKQTGAGISISTQSDDADQLKVKFVIYFDPTIISSTGARLDGQDNAPAKTALKTYLKDKNIADFNGELSLDKLIDVEQKVSGFKAVFLEEASSTFGNRDYVDDANLQIGTIDRFRKPNSGYFKLDEARSEFIYISKPD